MVHLLQWRRVVRAVKQPHLPHIMWKQASSMTAGDSISSPSNNEALYIQSLPQRGWKARFIASMTLLYSVRGSETYSRIRAKRCLSNRLYMLSGMLIDIVSVHTRRELVYRLNLSSRPDRAEEGFKSLKVYLVRVFSAQNCKNYLLEMRLVLIYHFSVQSRDCFDRISKRPAS